MRDEDRDTIRELPLFSKMDEPHFDQLMRAAHAQRFPPHVDLIHEGEPADFLYLVMEGSVELFSAGHGRETSMAIVSPVSTFILAATIKDSPFLMSARTATASALMLIPSQNVRSVFEEDPEFARAIVTELATCYRSVAKSMKNFKLRTAVERVGNDLLRPHEKAGQAQVVTSPHDKKIPAFILGKTPENLSRAFSALQAHGAIMDAARVDIHDREALALFSKPNPLIDDPRS